MRKSPWGIAKAKYLFGLRILLPMLLLVLLFTPRSANAYSLLTHEELIDLTWHDSIVPLLLSRYPNLTPAELENARAYAYGGCVIQDIGYYPYGDLLFSDLAHYVRSGDFVVSLFRNAHNANELAFAVGALSHYIGDSIGHPEATNLAVPIEFPRLRKKYGHVVNYAEGEHQHVQAEFAFDIDQIAHRRMAPLSYLRHVGLKVPVQQLALAFYETYGIRDFSGHHSHRFTVREYRFAVRTFIPRIAYSLTLLHRKHEPAEPDTPEAAQIEKETAAISALYHWDAYRKHAGFETYALAGLIFILPKFGPLSMLAVKGPAPAAEKDYMHSLYVSEQTLRQSLSRFTPPNPHQPDPSPASQTTSNQPAPSAPLPNDHHMDKNPPQQALDPRHPLPNRDLDTGHVVQPGGYSLTDDTYAKLLHTLTQNPSQPIPPGIQRDIQSYYQNLNEPLTTKLDSAAWAQVLADLNTLAGMPTSNEPTPYPVYGDDSEQAQPPAGD